jgi:hypothetical protein
MDDSIMRLGEEELKEIFSLFTSATEYERQQVYSPQSEHYYLRQNLSEEYSLTEEKREYALDAWRSVIYFLHNRGYSLSRDGMEIDLSFISSDFIT